MWALTDRYRTGGSTLAVFVCVQINQSFSQQVLNKGEKPITYEEHRGPFAQPDETPAPVSYRYRTFTLGKSPKGDEEDKRVRVR